MLTSIKIERFRGIPSLAIDDLGKVNIFIGKNGSGKTSILESINLMGQPCQPGLIHNLAIWRELPNPGPGNDAVFSTLFHCGDTKFGPVLHFVENGKSKQSITITATNDISGIPMPFTAGTSGGAPSEYFIPAIAYVFLDSDGVAHNSRSVIIQGQLAQIATNPVAGFGCFYIHARRATSIGEMANTLTTLSTHKNTEKFLEAITSFHENTKFIEAGLVGQHPTVLVDTGLPVKLPINVLGDGYCRMSLIATGLFFETSKTVCVDEIDSGLHVSVMHKFWKNVGSLARKYDKQVFCTTHNEEMLSQTIEAFSTNKGDLRIFRIDRTPDLQLVVTKYTYDTFSRSEELGLDIR